MQILMKEVDQHQKKMGHQPLDRGSSEVLWSQGQMEMVPLSAKKLNMMSTYEKGVCFHRILLF